jgi:hypothetical protein
MRVIATWRSGSRLALCRASAEHRQRFKDEEVDQHHRVVLALEPIE